MSVFVEQLERVRRAVPVRLLADFHALGLVDEYVRFLALKLARNDTNAIPPLLSPSYGVDQVWQTHMLHPQAYMATCRALLPRDANGDSAVIVHSPMPCEDRQRYARTLTLYELNFGVAPNPDVWPADQEPSSLSSQTTEATVRAPTRRRSAAASGHTVAAVVAVPSPPSVSRSAATTARSLSLSSPPPASSSSQSPLAIPSRLKRARTNRKPPPPPSAGVSIYVQVDNGRTYTFAIDTNSSVALLKNGITRHAGILLDKHVLLFDGFRLGDPSKSLRSYGIRDQSTIHVRKDQVGC